MVIHLLERYFKSKQDFADYLDRTYNPDKFEQPFAQFLNSLVNHELTASDQSNSR